MYSRLYEDTLMCNSPSQEVYDRLHEDFPRDYHGVGAVDHRVLSYKCCLRIGPDPKCRIVRGAANVTLIPVKCRVIKRVGPAWLVGESLGKERISHLQLLCKRCSWGFCICN